MNAGENCESCAYSEPRADRPDATLGLECHRHPPTVVALPPPVIGMRSYWPLVAGTNWCGEWADR